MANGKVVYFDSNRGFGFLAAEGGGDDVFLHINDISIDESLLLPGAVVEFDVESTERGSKALNLSVTQEAPAGGDPAAERGFRRDRGRSDRSEHPGRRDERGPARNLGGSLSDDITELLLDASPDLAARQVTAIRSRILDFATARGWLND